MQICGLTVMALLLYFFLRQKRAGLYTEYVFLETLLVTMGSVVLDICSVIAIHYADRMSRTLLFTFCKAYLISIMGVGCMALVYVFADMISEKKYRTMQNYLRVALAIEALIICFLPIDYYADEDSVYTYGPAVVMTYVFALLFIILAFISIFRLAGKMHKKRRTAFLTWMTLWFLAAFIQFLHNEWLLVGFACSCGMLIMFVTLENPESNIERSFGCFHSNALDQYLQQCYDREQRIAILMLSMAGAENLTYDAEVINDSLIELVHFLQKDKNAKVFKNMEQEIVAVFPDMSSMTKAYQAIQDKYYVDQYYEGTRYDSGSPHPAFPKTLFLLFPDSLIVSNKEEVYHLIQHIKVDGRDNSESQVCYVNQTILAEMQKQEDVKKVILDALDDDRVVVFYQPIYATGDKRFVSAEALVRIRATDGSIVPPGVFIPIAEECGIIGSLGERVFEKVCEFLHESNITELGIHYIEVNLSVVQCEQRDLADRYIRIMQKYEVNPWLINLEITETGSVQAKKILLENMKKLMDYGVSFSLDDFGNGQSNLDYVIDMPVSIMKLDMTMTQNYFKSLKAQFVMRAAITMAHDLDLFVVSEGVETKEQLEEMERLQIDYIQGYYFSKPLPQDEFYAFIEKHAEDGIPAED
jgi:EAL domain-containing protein (putative c-di-GMP-specific phosphodiesterase class I)